jgi:multidrug efflux pump subunit AcrA (membrane-fusion protein)
MFVPSYKIIYTNIIFMPEIITTPNLPSKSKGNIKLLSTEVQEIISQKPSWIVRNGIILFLGIIVMLLATTFFINYPDVVNANAKLSTLNAPKEVNAKTEGKLVKLSAVEGEMVIQDEVIGFIESRAIHNDVIALSETINTLQQTVDKNSIGMLSFSTKNLGEVQQPYQVFMQAFNTYKQYLSNGFYSRKKNMLQQDVSYLQRLHTNLQQQKGMQQEDLNLAGKTFDANKILSNEKVIADFEYRTEQSKYISKAMAIPQINSSLITNESAKHEKEKEIAQLENDIAQQKGIFVEALNTLKAQLDDWKSKFLLIAPVAGKISFAEFLQENSQIKIGQTVCFVNPENTEYYARIFIPQNNFGKIKTGEQVLLKLNAYPYREFGIIKAKLDFISAIPTDSGFVAKVILPNGLVTNYKKQLQYKEGLTAQAEIITADEQLSDRLFNELRAVFTRK